MSAALPPEVQAVLDAACALADAVEKARPTGAAYGPSAGALALAVESYRKSIAPPEPFEAYAHYLDAAINDPDDGYWYIDMRANPESDDDDVWRCTVTPIERVS